MYRILRVPRGRIRSAVRPPIGRHYVFARICRELALRYKQMSVTSTNFLVLIMDS